MIPAHILPHLGIMPQENFNCYTKECGKFIVHFAQYRERSAKEAAIQDTLLYLKSKNGGSHSVPGFV